MATSLYLCRLMDCFIMLEIFCGIYIALLGAFRLFKMPIALWIFSLPLKLGDLSIDLVIGCGHTLFEFLPPFRWLQGLGKLSKQRFIWFLGGLYLMFSVHFLYFDMSAWTMISWALYFAAVGIARFH